MMLDYIDERTQCRRWIVGAVIIASLGVALTALPLGDALAKLSYDLPFLFRSPVADTNVVVVFEDRASLDALGQTNWPPSRIVHARLVDRLRDEGAKVVVFDILFRNEKPEDEALAAAMQRHGNVILGSVPEVSSVQIGDQPGAELSELKAPTRLLRTNAAGCGLLLVGGLDPSFGVRKMLTSRRGHEAAIWLAAQKSGRFPADEGPGIERWINFYGAIGAIDRVTLGQVLQLEERRLAPGVLRGKIVFVGFDPSAAPASGERDLFATPYTRFGHDFSPGVEVLANACANLIRSDWLRRMNFWLECSIAGLFGIGAVALLIVVGRRWGIVVSIVLSALLLMTALLLRGHANVWWNWLVLPAVQLPAAALLALICPRLPLVAFISYRRAGAGDLALAIQGELRLHGYDAFVDVSKLGAGEFSPQLIRGIKRARNLVLLLAPGSFDERNAGEKDWMKKEISCALDENKQIIPILINGFKFPKESSTLPTEFRRVMEFEAIEHRHDQWDETVHKLLKFLLEKRRLGRTS